jgi:predicted  nucleic acid-binding Zn-ribbon protein
VIGERKRKAARSSGVVGELHKIDEATRDLKRRSREAAAEAESLTVAVRAAQGEVDRVIGEAAVAGAPADTAKAEHELDALRRQLHTATVSQRALEDAAMVSVRDASVLLAGRAYDVNAALEARGDVLRERQAEITHMQADLDADRQQLVADWERALRATDSLDHFARDVKGSLDLGEAFRPRTPGGIAT